MKLVAASLLVGAANAAELLVTNSAMSGGGSRGWNTTVWNVDTTTGANHLVSDTYDNRPTWAGIVCNNVYYTVWGDPIVGFGMRMLDLASGESTDLPTTSLFHKIACDPKDNSKLLGTASDFTSVADAYGEQVGDAPFHLKGYDPATQAETTIGTFPDSEVKWGGYDGIFSFTLDGSEVWASWPADECPGCSDATKGGHLHVMDTTTGEIKKSTKYSFSGLKKGTPYFLLPDAKRGVFWLGSGSSLDLRWGDIDTSGSGIKVTFTSDATALWDSSGSPAMCGDNVLAFEKGNAQIGGQNIDEIVPATGAIVNKVDLVGTLDIEGQDRTNLGAVACLKPSSVVV